MRNKGGTLNNKIESNNETVKRNYETLQQLKEDIIASEKFENFKFSSRPTLFTCSCVNDFKLMQ